jgi:hypothetical protein
LFFAISRSRAAEQRVGKSFGEAQATFQSVRSLWAAQGNPLKADSSETASGWLYFLRRFTAGSFLCTLKGINTSKEMNINEYGGLFYFLIFSYIRDHQFNKRFHGE